MKLKPLFWTNHAKAKMAFYRLSEQRVKRVLHFPERIEEGIAPDTIAMMQPASYKTKPLPLPPLNKGRVGAGYPLLIKEREGLYWTQEIWVMIEETKTKRKIISSWRYPGMTKKGEPLPAAILREMEEIE